MNKVEKAVAKYNEAKAAREQAYIAYESQVSGINKKIKALEEERERIHDKAVKPFKGRESLAENAMFEAQRQARKDDAQDLMYGVPSVERMQALTRHCRSFYGGTKAREVKNARPQTAIYGLSDGSTAWYLAFKGGKLISALKVDKSQHRGDTTYTHSYGIKKVSEQQRTYSRVGYSFNEWLLPSFVEFIGMTPKEKLEFEESFFGRRN